MLIVTFGSAELDIDKVAGSQAVSFCSSPSLEQGCRDVGLLASASPGRREGLAVIWQVECKGGAPAWGMQPAAPGVWPRARPLMPEAFPIKSKPCSAWGRRGPRFLPTVDDDIRRASGRAAVHLQVRCRQQLWEGMCRAQQAGTFCRDNLPIVVFISRTSK